MSERKIIHIDMDAFYASVEQRENPELRGKPVVVGGQPDSRGVVAAASYEARRFGVRSAMSCAKAYQLCPTAIFVKPRFDLYKAASQTLHKILTEASEKLEPLALDEAFLDVTENKLNEPIATRIAVYLRSRIKGQLGLTASAGVAPNKFLAKLASEQRKPDGLFVIPPDKVSTYVEKLPVGKLWGVGPSGKKKLNQCGIYTTADIRSRGLPPLIQLMGKQGSFLYSLSQGIDPREVVSERAPKSRGAETTFEKDISDWSQLNKHLERLSDQISRSLIQRKLRGRTITLKVRYNDFKTITRSRSVEDPINEPERILSISNELLEDSTPKGNVRLIGVSVSQFEEPDSPKQLSLL